MAEQDKLAALFAGAGAIGGLEGLEGLGVGWVGGCLSPTRQLGSCVPGLTAACT
jgi:hypothetical protein